MRKNGEAIAIYSRKSKYTGKGESIGNQIELCREYIGLHYGREALEKVVVFEDEGFSGGNLNRPGFKRMMEEAKERRLKAIIVYRLDRISRNISDFSGLIQELDRLNVDFVSIKEQFDTGTPMGRAMMYITSVFSQLERETIAERIRDNMHELAKTGRWLGGNTPTGYASEAVKNVTFDGKAKRSCRLKLIPKEAEIVKRIFELYTETGSLSMTESELFRLRIKSKNGRSFSRYTIKTILKNPVYSAADMDSYEYFTEAGAEVFADAVEFDGTRGLMAYNRTDQMKGRGAVDKPITEWIISVGEHEGIVTGRQWVKVQEILERNKEKAYQRPRVNTSLLTGILYCTCGAHMYPKLATRDRTTGEYRFWYVCSIKNLSRRSECDMKNADGNALDRAVTELIKRLDDDKRVIDLLEKGRKTLTGDSGANEERLFKLTRERDEAERKLSSLVDSLADLSDSAARSSVAKRIEELSREKQELDERIHKLEYIGKRNELEGDKFEVMAQLLSVFRNNIDGMTVDQKRAAIRTLVRKAVWDGRNAHVYLFGADEDAELPAPEDLFMLDGGSGK